MNSFCLSEPDASFVEILAAGRTNSWNDSTLTDLSADSSWEPKVLFGITHFRDNRSEFDSMKTIKKSCMMKAVLHTVQFGWVVRVYLSCESG